MATKQELETAIDNRFTLMDNTEEKKMITILQAMQICDLILLVTMLKKEIEEMKNAVPHNR